MPKYRAYVTLSQYRIFEFEADDDDLAWDHAEHLTDHIGYDRIEREWGESGEPYILIDEVEEIR